MQRYSHTGESVKAHCKVCFLLGAEDFGVHSLESFSPSCGRLDGLPETTYHIYIYREDVHQLHWNALSYTYRYFMSAEAST